VTIYAIRTKEVARFPSTVRCPFQVGAYMAECDSGWGGRGLRTVVDVRQITFYPERELADAMIARCQQYMATFEVVAFQEQP